MRLISVVNGEFNGILSLAGGEIWWPKSRCVELWGHPFCSTSGKSFSPGFTLWFGPFVNIPSCVCSYLHAFPFLSQVYFISSDFQSFLLLFFSCRVHYLLTMTIYVSSWRRWRAGCSTCPTSSPRTASPCSRAWLRSTLKRGSRYETVPTPGSYTGFGCLPKTWN